MACQFKYIQIVYAELKYYMFYNMFSLCYLRQCDNVNMKQYLPHAPHGPHGQVHISVVMWYQKTFRNLQMFFEHCKQRRFICNSNTVPFTCKLTVKESKKWFSKGSVVAADGYTACRITVITENTVPEKELALRMVPFVNIINYIMYY